MFWRPFRSRIQWSWFNRFHPSYQGQGMVVDILNTPPLCLRYFFIGLRSMVFIQKLIQKLKEVIIPLQEDMDIMHLDEEPWTPKEDKVTTSNSSAKKFYFLTTSKSARFLHEDSYRARAAECYASPISNFHFPHIDVVTIFVQEGQCRCPCGIPIEACRDPGTWGG